MRKTKLPHKPGVYVFLDKKGGILYVGRATSLKRRVASYFRNDLDPRIKEMTSLAVKIRHYVAETVLESFILEANLIKKYWPKYNIREKRRPVFCLCRYRQRGLSQTDYRQRQGT